MDNRGFFLGTFTRHAQLFCLRQTLTNIKKTLHLVVLCSAPHATLVYLPRPSMSTQAWPYAQSRHNLDERW